MRRGSWLRLLTTAAGVLAVAAGLAALAAGSSKGRAFLKSSWVVQRLNSPALRRLDAQLFNLRHEVLTQRELGDGGPVSRVQLYDPMGLDRDLSGALFVGDRGGTGAGHVIWRFAPDGTARIVAGTGRRGTDSEAADARHADLGSPQGLCVDLQGGVYFADSYNHVVLRVDAAGVLTRIAGTGSAGDGGDGGPAVAAALNQPYDARLDAQGNLYVADFGNHRIRKIDREGRITTAAGTGEPGYSGDGGPATAARLRNPYGVFADARYGVLIADSGNDVIRQVDSSGTIRTFAGTGRGYSGDGKSATEARFNSPQGLFVDSLGWIYVGDEHNHTIRVINPRGVVRRVAGAGTQGFSPDGTAALGGALNDVENVLVADGQVVFTEAGSHRLRTIDAEGRLRTLAGAAPRNEVNGR